MLYQISVEDIRFFKRQETTITNYAVLIYGAVLALATVFARVPMARAPLCGVLTALTILTAATAWWVLDQLQAAVQDARRVSVRSRATFSAGFTYAADATVDENVRFTRPGDLLHVFRSVLVVGMLLVLARLWLVP